MLNNSITEADANRKLERLSKSLELLNTFSAERYQKSYQLSGQTIQKSNYAEAARKADDLTPETLSLNQLYHNTAHGTLKYQSVFQSKNTTPSNTTANQPGNNQTQIITQNKAKPFQKKSMK